jgi:hypothetical protein
VKNVKEIAKMNRLKVLNIEIKNILFNMKYHTTCPLRKEREKHGVLY